jgi:hypothetical protein
MSFAREGYPMMAASSATAVLVLATAVWRRTWSLWLLGFVLLVVAVWVAWRFRQPSVPRTVAVTRVSAIATNEYAFEAVAHSVAMAGATSARLLQTHGAQ